jgi:hypothetical protein
VKPARREPTDVALLTTKPDCTRRVSTLQSAHIPVRGQADRFGVLEAATPAARAPTSAEVVEAKAAVSAFSEEEREHADRAAGASTRTTAKLFMETKDRDSDQAPRLLLLGGPQEAR